MTKSGSFFHVFFHLLRESKETTVLPSSLFLSLTHFAVSRRILFTSLYDREARQSFNTKKNKYCFTAMVHRRMSIHRNILQPQKRSLAEGETKEKKQRKGE